MGGNKNIAESRRNVGSAWILRGLRAGLTWHLGSLALGALLVAVTYSDAYLIVAMDSIGFMAATKKALSVMDTSDKPMSSSGLAMWIFHTTVGTSVAGICTLFTWMLTGTLDVYADPTSPWLISSREQVSILAGALAWTIMQCFMACMETAASTVLLCYTIDGHGTARCGNGGGDQPAHLKCLLCLLDEEKVALGEEQVLVV